MNATYGSHSRLSMTGSSRNAELTLWRFVRKPQVKGDLR
jgi:hypothetical protein